MASEIIVSARSKRLLPWIVAIAFFMQMLDTTILNIALPVIAKDLGVNPLQTQSAIIAYILTVALVIPLCGWFADRFGTQKVFFAAVALFTFGSIFCAGAQTLSLLIIGRIVQGLGGALMMPVGRLTILKIYPRHEFVGAISFVAIPGALGPLLGPTVGGWLVEYFSWHWIFLINVPVGVLGCIAAYKYLPNLQGDTHKQFDLVGFILFGSAMVLVSLALEALSGRRFPLFYIGLLFWVGVVFFVSYWWRAFRVENPLFPPQLFKTRSFSIGIAGNMFARLGSGSLPFLIPLLLQLALGYSPSRAGMMMIPMAFFGMLTKPLAKVVINHFGYRVTLTLNTLLLGMMISSFSLVTKDSSFTLLLILLSGLGFANSLQFTAMNTVTLIQLNDDLASSGNGLLSVVAQLSISFGIAIAAVLLSFFNGGQPHGGDTEVLYAFKATFFIVGLLSIFASSVFFRLPLRITTPHL